MVQLNKSIAGLIDHTLLKPEASASQIEALCKEALQYGFASVCVNPSYVPLVAGILRDSAVKTCCVIGFPLGATTTGSKSEETREAVRNGAQEVDMVINLGAVKSGDWELVRKDIRAVVDEAGDKAGVKVIIETCLLTDEEKVKACQIAKESGAAFVKTSTGFGSGGATVSDIRLMREAVGPELGVKASGGIRDYLTAVAMIEAGANRIGASTGIALVRYESEHGLI